MTRPRRDDSRPGSILGYVAQALDGLALWGMRMAFDAALHPPLDDFPRLRESAAPYLTAELQACPERFFDGIWEQPRRVRHRAEASRPIPNGTIVTRRFASEYVPFHASDDLDDVDHCAENQTIWVDHWMHEGPKRRPTLLALHGFGMGRPRLDARVLMADHCFELGLDVALMTLPFHGRRAPGRARYSGEQFASWHVGRLNEAVRQAVHDAWRVSRWLTAAGSETVGILGVSLGGYITALLAALRPEFSFAIPIVPAVYLEDLPLRLFGASRYGRAGIRPPLAPSLLRAAYRVHSPLTYPVRIPRARRLIVGGTNDGVTPGNHCSALYEHWGRPATVWFDGGHVAPFRRSRTVSAVRRHLQNLQLVGPTLDDRPAPAGVPVSQSSHGPTPVPNAHTR